MLVQYCCCIFFNNPSKEALFPRRFVPLFNRPRIQAESRGGHVDEEGRGGVRRIVWSAADRRRARPAPSETRNTPADRNGAARDRLRAQSRGSTAPQPGDPNRTR